MSEISKRTDRRSENVALGGLVIQAAAFGTLLLVRHWAGGSDAIEAGAVLAAVGLPIWVVLWIIFKQIRRVQTEELETAELKRARAAGAGAGIFEVDREDLLIEQNRLRWLVKWLMPACTVVLFIALNAWQFLGWGWSFETAFDDTAPQHVIRTTRPTLWMWFVVFTGFICFLFARYTLALARLRREWEILRAAGGVMAANALACLLLAITLMAGSTLPWMEPLYAYIIRAAMLVLAIELNLNFILDFYRPRSRRVIPRPSFESRLLGLVSEPGGIAKSIAEAINYQFGFEVSTTWFYQLLQRWFLPLVVATAIIILSLTTIVIVDAEETVIVERFGEPWRQSAGEAAAPVVLGPGFHLKLPYPIDVVRRVPVNLISEMTVGETGRPDAADTGRAILWTETHEFVPELMLLVASPDRSSERTATPGEGAQADDVAKSVSSSLIMVSVPVQYRIKDIAAYLYKYQNVEKLLEAVVYQIVTDHASSVDIDQMIGPGREAFNTQLRDRLQKRVDELELGIELVFVGLRGSHPPAQEQVAAAFQAVISAETQMAATINAARKKEQEILTAVAGSVDRARALDEAITAKNLLDADPAADKALVASAAARVNELLVGSRDKKTAPVSGDAAVLLADARNRAVQLVSDAQSKARIFGAEVAAYEAAPTLFKLRRSLDVFKDLDFVRKFLIAGDPRSVVIIYADEEPPAMDTILETGLEAEQSKN